MEHRATIQWDRQGAAFTDQRYSRGHTWSFDGGIQVPASASPHVVPSPWSVAAAIDPEEAFVASLSSCHMLWFLSLAAKRGYVVDSYYDKATGRMGPDSEGKLAMLEVILRPAVAFGADQPETAKIEELHHAAHSQCFIANSVKTPIRWVPSFSTIA